MTEGFFILSDLALSGMRAFWGFLFVCRLLRAGNEKNAGVRENEGRLAAPVEASAGASAPAVLTAVLAVVLAAAFDMLKVPGMYAAAGEAVLIAACAVWRRGTDGRMSLFLGVFYEIALALWTFLFGAWAAVLLNQPSCLEEGSASGQAARWGFYALFSVSALWMLRRREVLERKAGRLASLSMLVSFVGVISLSEQRRIAFSEDELYLWILMSLLLLVGLLVFGMRRQYEMERELARLQTEQRELLEREYRVLNQSYEANARLFHDFHNHMGALRELLSRQSCGEALSYLEELQGPVRQMAERVWTGDRAVDYLINSKAAEAERRQIHFQAETEFPANTNLRSPDLCAILGNLLDNALEAAGQVEDASGRFIRLVIRRMNQTLVIKVENSFHGEPLEDGGALKSTKAEGGLHGWGLKSAQAAAQKYDGMVRISWKDGVFRAVATLSFEGRKAAE